nr:cytochrome c oxidase subunit II [Thylacodes adamsii]
MSRWGQLGFMDANSSLMEEMIYFHDHAMMILVMIITLVGYAAVSFLYNSYTCRTVSEGQTVETIWTIVPAVILFFLALPSLRLLYLLDEVGSPQLTIKSIGHQWYWSYEYDSFDNVKFDSYMVPTPELEVGDYRLLEVDNRVVFPVSTEIRVLVTSADVIHSWAVPSLGIKADAVPGRLNQLAFTGKYPGIFYGQCSEICGANHSFMPIVMEGIPHDKFLEWLNKSE